jgi:hypothetical protein
LSAAVDGRSGRRNAAMGFYQLLHTMGVFGPDVPSRMWAFATGGRLSPAPFLGDVTRGPREHFIRPR